MSKTLHLIFFSVLHFLLVLALPHRGNCNSMPRSNAGFNGMFVFGDSIVDVGNNNFIRTRVKANYLPYGIDFRAGGFPTGRFTNRKNQADCLGDVLGFPRIPAFSDPLTKGIRLSFGVNYASAGSSILDSTGSTSGVMSLSQQIRNFVEGTLPNLEAQQGCPSADLLPHYLFLFATGSNDFLAYFLSEIWNSVTLESFTTNLTSSLATEIARLYDLGARKFAFLDIGPLGCTPVARAAMPKKACNEAMNYVAFLFNTQLIRMLNAIRSQMARFRFIVINFFQISLQFTTNPLSGGFSDVTSSCCEVSAQSGSPLCRVGGDVCSNRSNHMYFDGLHPTEKFYTIVAARAYHSNSTSEVYPFNLHSLAHLST